MGDLSPLQNAALVVGIIVGPLALTVSTVSLVRTIMLDRAQRTLEAEIEHMRGAQVAPPFPIIDGYSPQGAPVEVEWFRLLSGGAGATIDGLPTRMSGCALARNVVNWRSLGLPVSVATALYDYEPSDVDRASLVCAPAALSGQWNGSLCEQPVFFVDSDELALVTDVRIAYQHYSASP